MFLFINYEDLGKSTIPSTDLNCKQLDMKDDFHVIRTTHFIL